MDPITQGLLGAAVSQSVLTKPLGRGAACIGFFGGLLPDADVLLVSFSDPALPQELHRHFTHALAFIPVGGLLAALPFFCLRWCRQRYLAVLTAATVGYATHGLLDCCTSYGTHWLWPFSLARLSWDVISIIDPVFTMVLLVGIVLAAVRRRHGPATAACVLVMGYLSLGLWQHSRALDTQLSLARDRGHTPENIRATPTLGNLVVWRCLYVHDDRIYADAVRVGWKTATVIEQGQPISLFRPNDVPSTMRHRERITDILARFSHFSDGYTARMPAIPFVVADMRYSTTTAGFSPMWGILIQNGNGIDPVAWVGLVHDRREAVDRLWGQVIGPSR